MPVTCNSIRSALATVTEGNATGSIWRDFVLLQLYKIADKNGNGFIDKAELKEALMTLGFGHLSDAAV